MRINRSLSVKRKAAPATAAVWPKCTKQNSNCYTKGPPQPLLLTTQKTQKPSCSPSTTHSIRIATIRDHLCPRALPAKAAGANQHLKVRDRPVFSANGIQKRQQVGVIQKKLRRGLRAGHRFPFHNQHVTGAAEVGTISDKSSRLTWLRDTPYVAGRP